MKQGIEVLVLDDEPVVGDRLKPALEEEGCRVEVFVDPKEAMKRLGVKEFDVVITDIRMEEVDGLQILDRVRAKSERTKVIMITGYATVELARKSLTKGCFDFIAKPFKTREIREMVEKAAEALESEGQ